MANFGQIISSLAIGASQSVRRNAGDTAFEAYTPSAGGGDLSVFVGGGDAYILSTVATVRNQTPVVRFVDGVTDGAFWSVKVPEGATSISSIEILYHDLVAGGDIRTFIGVTRRRFDGSADQTDSETATYTTGATANLNQKLTLNAAMYDGITVQADDVLGIEVDRIGGDALDTYGANFDLIGIMFNFA